MKQSPNISLVILNYNGREVLEKCLASVFRVDYPSFSVIVVDNNSADGSLEAAKTKFSKAVFIKNEQNRGFASGNNIGIRFSLERGADYVLLLNNDTEVASDFLTSLVAVSEENKKVGILSPVIFKGNSKKVWFSGGKIDWFRMKTRHIRELGGGKAYLSDFITGCAMLVKKEVFKKIGLLDEDFFLYWEDADFSVRARKAGFECMVVPASKINHSEKSENNPKDKIYWLVVSGLLFFKKNTCWWLKPWINLYILARKIKNLFDIRFREDEVKLAVNKAYQDFKKYAAK